jgi:hypothetical protein
MRHRGLLLILMRKYTFHLGTSILRNDCMNRHNSRQGLQFG